MYIEAQRLGRAIDYGEVMKDSILLKNITV